MKCWPEPVVHYRPRPDARDVEPMGEETDFTGRTLRGWEYDGAVYPVTTWRQMLTGVVRLLAGRDPSAVRRYAATTTKFRTRAVQDEPEDGYVEVAPGLDVFVRTSTSDKMRTLRGLFHSMGLDADDLLLHLQPDGDGGGPDGDED